MPYSILEPTRIDPSFQSLCALTIMAKAPRAGRVKTRLSPPLAPQQAARLNSCFLRDTAANIASVAQTHPCAGVISYTPVGDEHLFEGLLPAGYRLVPQRGEGFGQRLMTTAEDLLACGFLSVCLIDSDSPTVPDNAFATAVDALRKPGDRIVLGPSFDGGYYLIGMKRAHPELFEKIPWSTASVMEATKAAVRRIGAELVTLPLWYDVDDAATLSVLREELIHGIRPSFTSVPGYPARQTRSFLEQMARPA